MTKVLVLYYSSAGYSETLAQAVAEGIRDAGVEPVIKRVPEPAPDELARKPGFTLDRETMIATVDELGDYDAVILGRYRTPTIHAGVGEPSQAELDDARCRGRHVARIAVKSR
jgi:multimeric flavodoxin WrbA